MSSRASRWSRRNSRPRWTASASSRSRLKGEPFDPNEHEAMALPAPRGRGAGHRDRGLPVGLPHQRRGPAAGPRGGGGIAMARGTDHYKTLGVDKKVSRGGHEEGVPQARGASTTRTRTRPAGAEERFKAISEAYDTLGRSGQAQEVRPRRVRVRRRHLAVRRRRLRRAAAPAARPTSARSRTSCRAIFNTGGGRTTRTKPATERGKDLETAVTLSFEQALGGRAGAGLGRPPTPACTTCRGTGARPGHVSPRSARSATAAASRPRARACSRSPARARAATASGTVIEEPVRDVRAARAGCARSSATGSTSPRACARARGSGWPGKGEAGLRGGPAGDLYVVTHVTESAGLQAQGRPLRGRGPDHGRRGARRRRGRGADAARHQEAARRAGHQARHGPAAARRGRRRSCPVPAGATCTIAS